MKVLFMPTNTGSVAFWRMYQYFVRMKMKGVDAFIYNFDIKSHEVGRWEHRFEKDKSYRNELYKLFKYADKIVLQYIHSDMVLALQMMFQEEFGKKFICEIDDHIIETPEYNPAFKGGFVPGNAYENVVREHMRTSDGIITSTEYLKEIYTQYNGRIDVIPNAIDFKFWNVEKKKSGRTRIGWIGGGNHDEDLKVMLEVIPAILNKYKDVEFCFVHGVSEDLKQLKKELKTDRLILKIGNWAHIDRYPKFVAKQGFDIGLAPLVMNSFNCAKSNLRWLEYSALSIPTVATDIEPYRKSIKHAETGFLCDKADEWIESLSELIEDHKMARRVADNAYISVLDNFNLEKVTDKYIKVLERY